MCLFSTSGGQRSVINNPSTLTSVAGPIETGNRTPDRYGIGDPPARLTHLADQLVAGVGQRHFLPSRGARSLLCCPRPQRTGARECFISRMSSVGLKPQMLRNFQTTLHQQMARHNHGHCNQAADDHLRMLIFQNASAMRSKPPITRLLRQPVATRAVPAGSHGSAAGGAVRAW